MTYCMSSSEAEQVLDKLDRPKDGDQCIVCNALSTYPKLGQESCAYIPTVVVAVKNSRSSAYVGM